MPPYRPLVGGVFAGGSPPKEAKHHLTETHRLSEQGKWGDFDGEEVDSVRFTVWNENDSEIQSLVFLSRLFNVVLGYLQQSGCGTPVKRMVYAGSIKPGSTRITGHLPDAFLQMSARTSRTAGKFTWGDLACPFEHKFNNEDFFDVSLNQLLTV